ALMLDYVLTVAVGISAGVGALISAAPELQPYTLTLCLMILAVITVVNLRGVRESGLAFVLPTYLFIGSLLAVLALGTGQAARAGPPRRRGGPPPGGPGPPRGGRVWVRSPPSARACRGWPGGGAATTGVPASRGPCVVSPRRTLTAIIALLAVMLAGIAYLCW